MFLRALALGSFSGEELKKERNKNVIQLLSSKNGSFIYKFSFFPLFQELSMLFSKVLALRQLQHLEASDLRLPTNQYQAMAWHMKLNG